MKQSNEMAQDLAQGLVGADLLRLRSAIDESAIVAITDSTGKITYANKKFCAISKYSLEELIGKNHRIINSSYHSPEFFTKMWGTISKGLVWEGEIRNRTKEGNVYWVHTTIVPFLDSSNRPEYYVSVRFEITEQKLAEERLEVQARKLEISNKELQDFASIAAHDLQEPLRKIQSFVDRLKSRSTNALDSESLDFLTRIDSSAHRMQNLINDLLTYSRVTTKAQPFLMVNLNSVIKQVQNDLELRIEQSKAKFLIRPLPEVFGDESQLRQLFQNLISNALKFQRLNSTPQIEVFAGEKQGDFCEIHVRDNGIGFDEKYLDRIFTIFQRLHGRHEFEGTGIGLAICRKIIDRHGGTLTAHSTLNFGSTFIAKLPLKEKTHDPEK